MDCDRRARALIGSGWLAFDRLKGVEYGVQVWGNYETVLDAARFAEEHSLAAVGIVDHYLMSEDVEEAKTRPALDVFLLLAALARETETIELSTQVSPVTFRHPAVMAKSAVTLDALSGGRFKLGIGAGWFDWEHEVFGIPFPSTGERFDMLEEALGYLQAAFDPSHPGYEGGIFSLEDFPLAPEPIRRIPLLVGGGGPHRLPRLAGTYADEYHIGGVDLEGRRLRIERARRAAGRAGRDPDRILISGTRTILGAENQAELDHLVGQAAADFGLSRRELGEIIVDQDLPIGTWDYVEDKLAEHEAIGIERIYLEYGWETEWKREQAEQVVSRLGN